MVLIAGIRRPMIAGLVAYMIVASIISIHPQKDNIILAKTKADFKTKKPKLILHVGPLKTATTTIQHFIFTYPDLCVVANELAEDNFKVIKSDWKDGERLVKECLLKLPHEDCNMKEWQRFTSMFDEAYSNNQNVAASYESLSLVKPNKDVKALFLSLAEKWDVSIIITYRSLETWYHSIYKEERISSFFRKKTGRFMNFESIYKETTPCNMSFSQYFTKNWKNNYFGDPLDTLETYQYFFGKDKVKTLMMIRPDHVDISEQFLCQGLEAKRACAEFKKGTRKKPAKRNKSKKFLVDHDLLVFAAHEKKLFNPECTQRHTIVERLEMYLNRKKITIHDLPKVCISARQYDELEKRAWLAEKKMSPFPRSRDEFDESFAQLKKESKFCNIDVDLVLSQKKWVKVFSNIYRRCKS